MEKEKASVLLPDGTIIQRTVTSVLKQVGPMCYGSWQHTIQYKGKKQWVEEHKGEGDAKYVLQK
jgi:hypothetical protein